MRNQPPFSCPQCGDTGLGGDKCLRCKVELVDRAGLPALTPSVVFLSRPTFEGFTHPWAMWLAGIAGFLSLFFVGGGFPWWGILVVQAVLWALIFAAFAAVTRIRIRQHRARVQAVADRIAAAPPVASIGASSGSHHIRGRVRLLQPIKGPLGDPVAAYLVRQRKERVEMLPAGRGQTRPAVTSVTVEESSGCGVFLVEDETGASLVDDDAVTIAPITPGKMDWDDPISLLIKDGDEVEIIGPAERKPATALPEIARSGMYREAPKLLVFDGKPTERVLILARP